MDIEPGQIWVAKEGVGLSLQAPYPGCFMWRPDPLSPLAPVGSRWKVLGVQRFLGEGTLVVLESGEANPLSSDIEPSEVRGTRAGAWDVSLLRYFEPEFEFSEEALKLSSSFPEYEDLKVGDSWKAIQLNRDGSQSDSVQTVVVPPSEDLDGEAVVSIDLGGGKAPEEHSLRKGLYDQWSQAGSYYGFCPSFGLSGMTEEALKFSAKNPRLGKCYELAGRWLMENRDPEALLVHGLLVNKFNVGYPFMDHAWIEKGDEVWEPIKDKWWPKDVFYALFDPTVSNQYSYEEMIGKALEVGHWGPWEKGQKKEAVLVEEVKEGDKVVVKPAPVVVPCEPVVGKQLTLKVGSICVVQEVRRRKRGKKESVVWVLEIVEAPEGSSVGNVVVVDASTSGKWFSKAEELGFPEEALKFSAQRPFKGEGNPILDSLKASGLSRILYHGTSSRYLPTIVSQGLGSPRIQGKPEAQRRGHGLGQVFLSASRDYAEGYAIEFSDPTIITFRIPVYEILEYGLVAGELGALPDKYLNEMLVTRTEGEGGAGILSSGFVEAIPMLINSVDKALCLFSAMVITALMEIASGLEFRKGVPDIRVGQVWRVDPRTVSLRGIKRNTEVKVLNVGNTTFLEDIPSITIGWEDEVGNHTLRIYPQTFKFFELVLPLEGVEGLKKIPFNRVVSQLKSIVERGQDAFLLTNWPAPEENSGRIVPQFAPSDLVSFCEPVIVRSTIDLLSTFYPWIGLQGEEILFNLEEFLTAKNSAGGIFPLLEGELPNQGRSFLPISRMVDLVLRSFEQGDLSEYTLELVSPKYIIQIEEIDTGGEGEWVDTTGKWLKRTKKSESKGTSRKAPRKAWVVWWAEHMGVQCFENEADAKRFQSAKGKDDAEDPVFKEVKSGWRIQKSFTEVDKRKLIEEDRKMWEGEKKSAKLSQEGAEEKKDGAGRTKLSAMMARDLLNQERSFIPGSAILTEIAEVPLRAPAMRLAYDLIAQVDPGLRSFKVDLASTPLFSEEKISSGYMILCELEGTRVALGSYVNVAPMNGGMWALVGDKFYKATGMKGLLSTLGSQFPTLAQVQSVSAKDLTRDLRSSLESTLEVKSESPSPYPELVAVYVLTYRLGGKKYKIVVHDRTGGLVSLLDLPPRHADFLRSLSWSEWKHLIEEAKLRAAPRVSVVGEILGSMNAKRITDSAWVDYEVYYQVGGEDYAFEISNLGDAFLITVPRGHHKILEDLKNQFGGAWVKLMDYLDTEGKLLKGACTFNVIEGTKYRKESMLRSFIDAELGIHRSVRAVVTPEKQKQLDEFWAEFDQEYIPILRIGDYKVIFKKREFPYVEVVLRKGEMAFGTVSAPSSGLGRVMGMAKLVMDELVSRGYVLCSKPFTARLARVFQQYGWKEGPGDTRVLYYGDLGAESDLERFCEELEWGTSPHSEPWSGPGPSRPPTPVPRYGGQETRYGPVSNRFLSMYGGTVNAYEELFSEVSEFVVDWAKGNNIDRMDPWNSSTLGEMAVEMRERGFAAGAVVLLMTDDNLRGYVEDLLSV